MPVWMFTLPLHITLHVFGIQQQLAEIKAFNIVEKMMCSLENAAEND